MTNDTQLLAWALDRAIEISKLEEDGAHTVETVKQTAENIVEWIASKAQKEELPDETTSNEVN